MKKLLVLVIGFMLICGGFAHAADLKIGVADFEKIFNEYWKTKSEDAKLKADLDAKKTELDKKREEINKMRDAAELLGEDAKKEKEKEIRDKIKELGEASKAAEDNLLKERNEKWLQIYGEIKDVVSKYGKDNKYNFVFDDKAMVYKSEGYDITAEIVKILNKDSKEVKETKSK